MYEELLRCLRAHAKPMNCADNCICRDAVKRGYGSCSDELAKLAADAIEELTATAESYKRSMEAWADTAAELAIKLIPGLPWMPTTNADGLRAMTDEELAKFLYKSNGCPMWVSDYTCKEEKGCEGATGACWLDWLKE